jgi:hypothetical protein
MMLQKNKAVRERQLTYEREVGGVAEIRITVLGPHPPIVGDGRALRALVRSYESVSFIIFSSFAYDSMGCH